MTILNIGMSMTALTSLDATVCPSLVTLHAFTNTLLETVDVTGSNAIEDARLYNCLNLVTLTGLSGLTSLDHLNISQSALTSLDVSNNSALRELRINTTKMSSIDLSSNVFLERFLCSSSLDITAIDLSNNPNLTEIYSSNNSLLASLNISNSNNSFLTNFEANLTPLLSCIQVDDVAYSTANWITSDFVFDAIPGFSVDCSAVAGIIEDALGLDFSLYPNPVVDQLQFGTVEKELTYTVVTVNGQVVLTGKLTKENKQIRTASLSSGTYFLKLNDAEGLKESFKFVKK
jgi:hypothetical protein